jgi:UDPglucose 6-dehydrogenase
MDPSSAEMTKYVANAMLAMRIAFMNEVAVLCEQVGADVHDVRLGVGSDPRIGPKFLYAGPGYGGSCFPKDLVALVQTARDHNVELELAATTHRVNERHKGLLLRKLKRHFDGDLRGRQFAIWGAAFKPGTDDVRESPALTLVDGLLSEGAEVAVHDPAALSSVRSRFPTRVRACDDPYDAADGAHGLVLMTEWGQYRSPDFPRLARVMARPLLLDGRNIWSTYALRDQGFLYEGIGVRS